MRDQALSGSGSAVLRAAPDDLWAALLDPAVLRIAIPNADHVSRTGDGHFTALISFGVGRWRGRYVAELDLSNVRPPHALDLEGQAAGGLGRGTASAHVTLSAVEGGCTRVGWRYRGRVAGPVALVGRALLQAGSDIFIKQFFRVLADQVVTPAARGGAPGRPASG